MTDLILPPWVRISGVRFDFVSNTAGANSVFTGATRSLARAGDRIKISIGTQNANDRESDPSRAQLKKTRAELRGQGNRLWYCNPAYIPRGSFPATELLTNSTFGNGTTGWTGFGATGALLSVQDRTLRVKSQGYQSYGVSQDNSVVAQYAPHIFRAFFSSGKGPFSFRTYVSDGTVVVDNLSPGAQAGLGSAVIVPLDSDVLVLAYDSGGSHLVDDYYEVRYMSLSRCALVDNKPNLFLHSDDFTNGVWITNGSAGVGANASVAPDGSSTADEFDENAATTEHYIFQQTTISSAASDVHFGVALKAVGRSWVALQLYEGTAGSLATAYFNISSGVKGAVSAAGNWSNARSFIVSLGNGWHACHLVARKTNSATIIRGLTVSTTGDGGALSVPGINANAFYLWRGTANLSSVPTRLRQTTTAADSVGISQTGSSLELKGLPTNTNGLLLHGDWPQITNQLCMVVGSLNSDAAGLGYLQLAYPLRSAPADNAPVIIHQPMGRFILTSNEGGWDERPGIFSDHEFELVESLDQ